ncbi:MAG TPA: ABC transporter permease subunit [Anaerohalosphaeraceae bacterium]|nr:ABC transporter permease subunit [Anaerohalosphaeraceae bacterium]HOL88673.1 ABC transporter permease subunit [Anaerohalosphaeraceae bacterium]HPP57046.1 ABC transporter permease subunit [Anaerohalosphaeraceae bacterium]
MFGKLFTIAKNTTFETLRQPIYIIIIICALLLLLLAPAISMYTLDEDVKLLRELAFSTLFLAGLFISVFSAGGAVTEEIETGTITTVLSKPIPRPLFLLGKFAGLAFAATLAHYFLSIAMLMAIRHGVLERATDEPDWVVITAAAVVLLLTVFISALLNYFYEWHFSSTAVVLGTILGSAGLLFLAFVDRDWKVNPSQNGFHLFDINASVLLLFAVLITVALAVLFSTRLNIILTLLSCVSVFLLGLITDWLFGRLADKFLWAKIGYILVPNFQVFWVSDAIYENKQVPADYLLMGLYYAVLYISAILFIAIALFQNRQVGQNRQY